MVVCSYFKAISEIDFIFNQVEDNDIFININLHSYPLNNNSENKSVDLLYLYHFTDETIK